MAKDITFALGGSYSGDGCRDDRERRREWQEMELRALVLEGHRAK